MIGFVPDAALATINGLEILAIIYLALAISKLRERLSHMEGKTVQRERDNGK